jgi:hypothetical protein
VPGVFSRDENSESSTKILKIPFGNVFDGVLTRFLNYICIHVFKAFGVIFLHFEMDLNASRAHLFFLIFFFSWHARCGQNPDSNSNIFYTFKILKGLFSHRVTSFYTTSVYPACLNSNFKNLTFS